MGFLLLHFVLQINQHLAIHLRESCMNIVFYGEYTMVRTEGKDFGILDGARLQEMTFLGCQ